ncbi:spore germination protein [Paenibacillus hamazuiensis]|uniref:spore germination protein n=1 Tax=Paenibacillus hamazuiensis TaxID=2936508 RepID=UPI00200C1386|nr:spore germination protein [Paenibacillus hamazuiensis]
MPSVINIFYMKINSIASNGSVNIGESLHNSPTANTKSQGLNASYGDTAPPQANMKNIYIDPDVNDMGEVASKDTAISSQI